MATDSLPIEPPDDTGSDTLRRYAYQAYVTVPYCLQCFTGTDIQSVIPEHFEDVAVQYKDDKWAFIQIKSRAEGQRPWTLASITGAGGGLSALLRTHRSVEQFTDNYTLVLALEGGYNSADPIALLLTPDGHQNQDLRKRLTSALAVDESQLDKFLAKVSVRPALPRQQSIAAENLRAMGQLADLQFSELEQIHESLVGLIMGSMQAARIGPAWPTILFQHSPNPESAAPATLSAKRLTPEGLNPILAQLAAPTPPLLLRMADLDAPRPTTLEQKLLAGGASSETVEMAMDLRASAAIHRAKMGSLGRWGNPSFIADMRGRLRIFQAAVVASVAESASPAQAVWSELVNGGSFHADELDPRRMYDRDRFALVGEMCQMSDECLVEWGQARAI